MSNQQALIKKALLELRGLRNQVRALKREKAEPIAVVGMACRFPGDGNTPEAYWDLLRNGRSGIVEVPKDRWDIDAYYDPDPDAAGKVYTRWGGYIGKIDGFDNRFFGITPKEAADMDPQQRLILEVAWEALERANINPNNLYGSDTGVFLGYGNWEHAVLRFGVENPEKISAYTGTGSCGCVAAGRIAYFLGLRGPNFAVDTACSSSLLSTHLAAQSLRRGECNVALAGGSHLLLTPAMTICFCRARMMAPDGRCKTFDERADGYVRGEGCGMLVLKRLSDAEADGDTIYALVRGSASNQDGASGGLTVPSGPAQEDVIRKALADGEIDPDEVTYVEAHGTGTKLGDPVEIGALGNTYCGKPRQEPLTVGSVKTNVGHLESSAGISALIKTILMLHHREIPPHINFEKANPHIPFDKFGIRLPLEAAPWKPVNDRLRLAGISSFGFSGTNVHVVLQEYPSPQSPPRQDGPCFLGLSAKSEEALRIMAGRYAEHLLAHPEQNLRDICFTANHFRAVFNKRLAVVAENTAELAEKLRNFAEGGAGENLFFGKTGSENGPHTDLIAKAKQFAAGKPLLHPDYGADPQKVALPFYPFQHIDYPFQAEQQPTSAAYFSAVVHPLLGARIDTATGEQRIYESLLSADRPGYLSDHKVAHRIVLPGAAYLEIALQAGRQRFADKPFHLQHIEIREPMFLDQKVRCQTILSGDVDTGFRFQIYSAGAESSDHIWTLHMEGRIVPGQGSEEALAPIDEQAQQHSVDYRGLANQGIQYGPAFQVLKDIRIAGNSAEATLEVDSQDTGDLISPSLLDGCFQLIQQCAATQTPETLYLPVALAEFTLHRPCRGPVKARIRLDFPGKGRLAAGLDILDQDDLPIAQIRGLLGAAFDPGKLQSGHLQSYIYQIQPQVISLKVDPQTPKVWSLFNAENNEDAAALAKALQDRGYEVRGLSANGEAAFPSLPQGSGLLYFQNPGQDEQADQQTDLAGLRRILQQTGSGDRINRLVVITRDTEISAGAFHGALRVAAIEKKQCKPRLIRLTDDTAADHLLDAVLAEPGENEIIIRAGKTLAPRLGPYHHGRLKRPSGPIRLNLSEYGQMENLRLSPVQPQKPGPGQVTVKVHSSGLNFRDVLNALGMLAEHARTMGFEQASDMPFGFECAGTISALGQGSDQFQVGDPVIAVLCPGSLADEVLVNQNYVTHKPDNISFEDAATLSTTFLTALYGLNRRASMKAGDKVLIHAAAGGVGLSALRLAQLAGAEIYATASPGKHEFLRRQGVNHIYNSRDLNFAEQLLKDTDGQGVDLVLNSLNGEFIEKSLEVTAKNGRFVEIGKLGIWSDEQVAGFRPDIAYHAFDLNEVAGENPAVIAELMDDLQQLIRGNQIRPLPKKVYDLSDAPEAFRYMAQGKHIGKIVLRVQNRNTRLYSQDGTYLITGGNGAIGQTLARRLAEQGAGRIVLCGRRALDKTLEKTITELEKAGARAEYQRADITDADAVGRLLENIRKSGPPLRGIIHAAGVLIDKRIDELAAAEAEAVLAPKILGSLHLDRHSQNDPLDFFVLFSSISALLGNPGQFSYAAANAFMDHLARHRRERGLTATSINWGAWRGAGMGAEARGLERMGVRKLDESTALDLFEWALTENIGQAALLDLDWQRYGEAMNLEAGQGILADLLERRETSAQGNTQGAQLPNLIAETEPGRRLYVTLEHTRQLAAALMGFEKEHIAVDVPLPDQGLDSLMAVELRNKIGIAVGSELPVSLFFDYPTLEKLAVYLLEDVMGSAPANAPQSFEEPQEELSGDALLEELESLLD